MQRESAAYGEPTQIGERATAGVDFDPGATIWLHPPLPAENELVDRDPGTDIVPIPVTAGR